MFSAEILGGRFPLRTLPYPASALLYIALRWAQDRILPADATFPIDHLNRLFRAFFWSNVLVGRYDQGFLSLFAADLKELRALLLNHRQYASQSEWARTLNAQLDAKIFSGETARLSEDALTELLKSGEVRGARRQAITLFLLSRAKLDLVTGKPLDLQTEDRERKVQLHHIFPKQWCVDNRSGHEVLKQDEQVVDSFANLVPLAAESNNRWKSKAPATALQNFGIKYDANDPRFSNSFIDEKLFAKLTHAKPDPESFWEDRARQMAKVLHDLQYVSG